MSGWIWALAIGAMALMVFLVRATRTLRIARKARPELPPAHYTAHAKERMLQRGIARTQVEEVLRNPSRAEHDSANGSVRLERDFGDQILKVWVVQPWPSTETVVIKTAAWKYVTTITVPTARMGLVIGHKGRTIEAIREETGAQLRVDGSRLVHISAGDRASMENARLRVLSIVGPSDIEAIPAARARSC